MNKSILIAINTFKEMIRDRVLYLLLFFSFFLIAFSYLLGALSFAEQQRIITNMGLMAIQISCCGLAVFLGSSLVWREIERQTVLVLLSKPISRFEFLFGKYLGLSLVLILLNAFLSLVLFIVCYKFEFFTFKNYSYFQLVYF
ncbi:MAG: ABC transporter permease subunit [Oligoflexia bacterium]|nr:ABC transporter permease subunit [Oligoflexia bacterium]